MKIFGAMYDKTMAWSKHRYATFFSVDEFIEAIFSRFRRM
ncbi:LppB [Pasteurella multocida subsp. multocida str. Anand1_buffalo]|nr:LppB [Pasteurella multocida subsp. multocida str. Anand1_buffalo]